MDETLRRLIKAKAKEKFLVSCIHIYLVGGVLGYTEIAEELLKHGTPAPLQGNEQKPKSNRSGFRFLNAPHINNRPLKTSLSYAKWKPNNNIII
jgi:hypothetical protein